MGPWVESCILGSNGFVGLTPRHWPNTVAQAGFGDTRKKVEEEKALPKQGRNAVAATSAEWWQ